MSVELIGVITFIFGLIGLFVGPNFIVYAFFGSTFLEQRLRSYWIPWAEPRSSLPIFFLAFWQ